MPSVLLHTYQSPVGELILGSFENHLCLCDWRYRKMREAVDERIRKGLRAEFEPGKSHVISDTIKQLDEYFSGKRRIFDIPLQPVGTDFQQQVWKALREIPFGQTSSYLKLSQKLGNPDAVRAVASANGANALSILIPCHRIIGSDGSLVGYAGGLAAKKQLLGLENINTPSSPGQLAFF